MTYRELLDRKIFLWGTEKRCRDIEDFFCELTVIQTMCFDEVPDEEQKVRLQAYIDKKEERDLWIISEGYSKELASFLSQIGMCHENEYIWLEDLLEVTQEMETFYIDKMKPRKKIAVYGNGEMAKDMMDKNPNLRVDYVITEEFFVSGVIGSENVKKEELFLILAVEVDSKIKQLFIDQGFIFGRDFHFYNPRIPKQPTSYYLKKTFYDKPIYILPCDYTTRALSVKNHGNVMACCSSVTLALGNCKYTSIEEITSGIQAQIVNLTMRNRTYSFCGEMCFMFRERAYCLKDEERIAGNKRRNDKVHAISDFNVQLGYDRSCNLACRSCRTHRITEPEESKEIMEMIHTEVKNMCLKQPRNLRIGNGELFFSQYYKDVIFNHYKSKKIALITNGMLFNRENWERLENRYEQIFLEVSMDTTKKETYKKLRGGNFDILLKNMEFASELRKENKLKRLSISFVIQVDNFEEMVAFVEYGNRICADYIHFIKLNHWGHIPEDEFIKLDVYDPRNNAHKKFVEILHHPIFQNRNVHVDNINNFVETNNQGGISK